MTYIYLILLLCTFTNAHWQNEDRIVEHGTVPTVHLHTVHEKHAREAAGDHSSRSDDVEDVSEHRMVPQDVLDALQEISRRRQLMQRPPLPLQINYQIPQKKYPQRPKFYGLSRSVDETSAAERESKQGGGGSVVHAVLHDAVSASRRQELDDEKSYHHPQYDVAGRSDVVYPVTLNDVSRSNVPGYVVGVDGAVEGLLDAVRTPYVNVGASEANRETVRGELNAAEEAIRASLYYLDEADHTANRAPVDVNRVSPVYDNQEDSRERTSGRAGIGGLRGMGGLGGLGGLRGLGGISGLNQFGGIGGMGGLGGLSGIPTSPGGIKLYNIPKFPNPLANQYPGLYGR